MKGFVNQHSHLLGQRRSRTEEGLAQDYVIALCARSGYKYNGGCARIRDCCPNRRIVTVSHQLILGQHSLRLQGTVEEGQIGHVLKGLAQLWSSDGGLTLGAKRIECRCC